MKTLKAYRPTLSMTQEAAVEVLESALQALREDKTKFALYRAEYAVHLMEKWLEQEQES